MAENAAPLTTVALARCPTYEPAALEEALTAALKPLGGWEALVRPGDRVCLKVNLLRAAAAEAAVTTHPSFVRAVARAVRRRGATAVLADSPGGGIPYTRAALRNCYRRAGYLPLAEEEGVTLNYDTSSREVHNAAGSFARRFNVISPVLDADVVLNLCKLKTHAFTYLTGGVKNCFGVIPGYDKPGFHGRLVDVAKFAEMLLEVALYVRPALTLMDAVVAMEGNGPGLGEPRAVGLVVASPSALAVDVVAGMLTGLPPADHPVVAAAARRGILPHHPDHVRVAGEDLAAFRPAGWRWPPTVITAHGFAGFGRAQGAVSRLFRSAFSVQPRVRPRRCTGCGACVEACPVGAAALREGKSVIDEQRCVRCYCCHEACPEDAIQLERSLLHRLLSRAA